MREQVTLRVEGTVATGPKAAVMRKTAWRLIPLLGICYTMNVLDRFNISVAALTMNRALGLTATTYGLGAGAFFWGYTLFQMPANAALTRIGARRWITALVLFWGVCSMGTALATGVETFVLARFLLGVAEAGFLPGVIFFMTCWFPALYRGRAMGVFYAFGAAAGLLVGPLSANLLTLDGYLGASGWRWVFLIEGLPTFIMASLCPFVLRDRPADATWLAGPEREWLEQTLESERNAAAGAHLKLGQAIASRQFILLAFVSVLGGLGLYSKIFFMPLIFKTFGLSDLGVGYWMVVPNLVGIIGMLVLSRSSDRTGERTWHLATSLLIGGVGLVLAGFAIGNNAALTIAAFALSSFGISAALPLFWNLPTAFLGATAAAGGIAFIGSVGNLSGYAASQLTGLLHDVSGSYQLPMIVMGVMVAIGGLIVPCTGRLLPKPANELREA